MRKDLNILVPVLVNDWNEKRGRYDKTKSIQYFPAKANLKAKSIMLVESRTGKVVWEHVTDAELFDQTSGRRIWRHLGAPEWHVEKDPRDDRRRTWKGENQYASGSGEQTTATPPEIRPMAFWHFILRSDQPPPKMPILASTTKRVLWSVRLYQSTYPRNSIQGKCYPQLFEPEQTQDPSLFSLHRAENYSFLI